MSAESEVPEVQREPQSERRSLLRTGAIVLVAAGVAVALLVGTEASQAFVYSKLVDEVAANPDAFEGKVLRVEGELVQGSILFRKEPCEWRFKIQEKGQVMAVRFAQCVVPDTFRDGFGIRVTAQGKLDAEHVLIADQIIPRCPSKYEMKQKAARGEEIPHSMSPIPQEAPAAP